MRIINLIVVHCSATRGDCTLSPEDLDRLHRRRGFNGTGYHYYIRKDGTVHLTRPIERIGAHAKGFNAHSIGICYEGGLDCRGRPADTLVGYSDSDYAGCKVDRKSTSGTCQFLGRSLVSWNSKKQTSVALSTAEAEYVAAGQCCAQLLWMRQTLRDFGYNLSKVPLLCDNESAIRMADNPVEHSRTKHINIRHHFLRDHQQKGDIEVFHVSTENQLADIFTKPLDEKTFCRLRSELNVLDSRNLD